MAAMANLNNPYPLRPELLSRIYLVVMLGLLTVVSPGCSGVLESSKPAREVFLLDEPADSARTSPSPDAPKLKLSMTAVPGLDTDRITVLGPDSRLSPVANAHWADHVPEVILSIMRRTLSDSGMFRSVREESLPRPGDWQLEVELQAFYGILGAASKPNSVRVRWEGFLTCEATEHTFLVDESSSVGSDSLAALVAAHQSALDAGLKQLAREIDQRCSVAVGD